MVSWAVTGATRGIGFGWIEKLSANPQDRVFALIRSRATAAKLEELAAQRKNIHILVTDMYDPTKLDLTAAEVSQITGGSLDVLVLNAGSAEPETSVLPPSAFYGKAEALEKEINDNVKSNLTVNVFTINAFLPLIRKGTEKKIAFVSSQSGDIEFTRVSGFATVVGYSAAKAGMNLVMTKYAAELAPEGIKTISISPGWVNTDAAQTVTGDPIVRAAVLGMFRKVDPDVNGPAPVEDSVSAMLERIQKLTEANSGTFVTHRGNEQWF